MLVELRDRIVERLAEQFSATLKDVKAHPGRFTLEQIKDTSFRTPAARVTFLNINRARLSSAGQVVGPIQFVIFLVTRGKDGDRDGIALAESVADFVQFNQWGLSNVEAAQITGIDNLFNEATDATGVNVFAVSFMQDAALGRNRALDDIEAQSGFDGLQTLAEIWVGGEELEVDP